MVPSPSPFKVPELPTRPQSLKKDEVPAEWVVNNWTLVPGSHRVYVDNDDSADSPTSDQPYLGPMDKDGFATHTAAKMAPQNDANKLAIISREFWILQRIKEDGDMPNMRWAFPNVSNYKILDQHNHKVGFFMKQLEPITKEEWKQEGPWKKSLKLLEMIHNCDRYSFAIGGLTLDNFMWSEMESDVMMIVGLGHAVFMDEACWRLPQEYQSARPNETFEQAVLKDMQTWKELRRENWKPHEH